MLSGGFDSFEIDSGSDISILKMDNLTLKKMIKFGNKIQQDKSSTQIDIFGGAQEIELESPKAPICEKMENYGVSFKRKRGCWYLSICSST